MDKEKNEGKKITKEEFADRVIKFFTSDSQFFDLACPNQVGLAVYCCNKDLILCVQNKCWQQAIEQGVEK